jgi:hypothetical protein
LCLFWSGASAKSKRIWCLLLAFRKLFLALFLSVHAAFLIPFCLHSEGDQLAFGARSDGFVCGCFIKICDGFVR